MTTGRINQITTFAAEPKLSATFKFTTNSKIMLTLYESSNSVESDMIQVV